ncbi:MAG TPA: L-2-amino-thiazoline-4-carboxylic acid hydrolase [Panacibacter sp.]|nr:L-2-amino-thiazoline-4-carboxylic acid hydrolase [Panacibacter sp.]
MPSYKKYFHKAIKHHYPEHADTIIVNVEDHFKNISVDTAFAATSSNPIDRRLDFSAYFLALIKTLDELNEPYEKIRIICLETVLDYVRPKNKLQKLLKKIPAKLVNTWLAKILLPVLDRKFNNNENSDGFIARIITDKNETFGLGYGFDILECGICKLFMKHNYQKYVSILCEVDEVTSGLAGLILVRTGTIALGAKKCDFRFKKIDNKAGH